MCGDLHPRPLHSFISWCLAKGRLYCDFLDRTHPLGIDLLVYLSVLKAPVFRGAPVRLAAVTVRWRRLRISHGGGPVAARAEGHENKTLP
jgi:hypothetical protein